MSRRLLLSFLIFWPAAAWSANVQNELPAPSNLTAVVLAKTITLNWQWPRPEELPVFKDLGYEVKRSDGKIFQVHETALTDFNLAPGKYSYRVRVRGVAKKTTYVSDWTPSVSGTILESCPRAPTVELTVEPTQKAYSSVSSLRFHIKGNATVDSGCTLSNVKYHFDTGTGIVHTGPLEVGTTGQFDKFVNAFGPEDEIPPGHASFSFTVSAEDEAGPVTSDAFTLEMELRNPYAPH